MGKKKQFNKLLILEKKKWLGMSVTKREIINLKKRLGFKRNQNYADFFSDKFKDNDFTDSEFVDIIFSLSIIKKHEK